MGDRVKQAEKKDLSDILSAIREMVHKDTRSSLSEIAATPSPAAPASSKTEAKLPTKILILRPHMRVYAPSSETDVLDESTGIPHDTPFPANDSFAVANPAIDEHMLRDMVREVVQEQLRGELGKEIIGALKRDMALLLEKKS